MLTVINWFYGNRNEENYSHMTFDDRVVSTIISLITNKRCHQARSRSTIYYVSIKHCPSVCYALCTAVHRRCHFLSCIVIRIAVCYAFQRFFKSRDDCRRTARRESYKEDQRMEKLRATSFLPPIIPIYKQTIDSETGVPPPFSLTHHSRVFYYTLLT